MWMEQAETVVGSLRDAQASDLEQLAALFRILADKTRIEIITILVEGEMNVTDLCERLHLPQPTVSHHLSLLRMNNIVAHHRNGKQVFYGLNGHVEVEEDGQIVIHVQRLAVTIGCR